MTDTLLEEAGRHHAAGRVADAMRLYQAALARTPGHPDALAGLGIAALDGGQPELGRRLLTMALEAKPGDPLILNSLANAAKALGDLDAATAFYRRAVALLPDRAELVVNLAAMPAMSARWSTRALLLAPLDPDAWFVRAAAAMDAGWLGTAVRAQACALALAPAHGQAWFNRGNALRDLGEVAAAVAHYRRALAIRPSDEGAASNLLFALCFVASGAEIDRANRLWGAGIERAARIAPPFANTRDPDRRLTIGYLTPDFRRHQFLKHLTPLLDHHDRARFRLIAYADVPKPDEETERLKPSFDLWRDIARLDDEGLDRQVREDGVDILVCLTGYVAAWRRRFVPRKAPVQVAAINQVGSLGLAAFDARLTDRWLEPPEQAAPGPERLIRLPSGYTVFEPPADAPALTPPPLAARGHATFGSFNNLSKLTDASLALFREVLAACPGARLVIKAMALSDEEPRARFERRLAQAGLARHRVDLVGRIPGDAANLAALAEVDIALDPTPFNGGMSTVDTLWMGVPVVSLAGSSLVGRVGASLLCRAGLADFVAESPGDYVRIAAGLARDPERLTRLRLGMRRRLAHSSLTNGRIFARDVEQAYRWLWHAWCHG